MNCSYGRMIDAPNKPSAFSVSEWVCAYVSKHVNDADDV